jgi:hypothetical protein
MENANGSSHVAAGASVHWRLFTRKKTVVVAGETLAEMSSRNNVSDVGTLEVRVPLVKPYRRSLALLIPHPDVNELEVARQRKMTLFGEELELAFVCTVNVSAASA